MVGGGRVGGGDRKEPIPVENRLCKNVTKFLAVFNFFGVLSSLMQLDSKPGTLFY